MAWNTESRRGLKRALHSDPQGPRDLTALCSPHTPGRRAEGRITDGALEALGGDLRAAFGRALKSTEGKRKDKEQK